MPRGLTAVNLQGKVDQKYILSIGTTRKPKRSFFADGYPDGPEENMERLKDAGEPLEQVLPVCRNCNGKNLKHLKRLLQKVSIDTL